MKGTENIQKPHRDRIGVVLYVLYVLMLMASVALIVRIVKNVFQQALAMKSELDLTV